MTCSMFWSTYSAGQSLGLASGVYRQVRLPSGKWLRSGIDTDSPRAFMPAE